jgi:hypothetical protein
MYVMCADKYINSGVALQAGHYLAHQIPSFYVNSAFRTTLTFEYRLELLVYLKQCLDIENRKHSGAISLFSEDEEIPAGSFVCITHSTQCDFPCVRATMSMATRALGSWCMGCGHGT